MSAIPKSEMTPQEYLEFERKSEEKHEYLQAKSLQWQARGVITIRLRQILTV